MLFPLAIHLRERSRKQVSSNENPGWLAWVHLFFWTIVTHPLLDCCTTYGTQLFEPFSSMRVAWNVIAVADPLYTGPFLVFLVLASRQARGSRRRQVYNWAGIAISSAYMLLCTALYFKADERMEQTLAKEQIVASRQTIGPTIFNNILWQGAAETDSTFYMGQYSYFDTTPYFKLSMVSKRHDLLQGHWDDPHVKVLRWFTNDFFSVEIQGDSLLRMNDLRYGQLDIPGKPQPQYIFFFDLKEENGELRVQRLQQGPEDRMAIFGLMWARIMGE